MRVIFDRSAFHGDRFDLLKGSRLSQPVQERKIFIYHTRVFLEETFRNSEVATRGGLKNRGFEAA